MELEGSLREGIEGGSGDCGGGGEGERKEEAGVVVVTRETERRERRLWWKEEALASKCHSIGFLFVCVFFFVLQTWHHLPEKEKKSNCS